MPASDPARVTSQLASTFGIDPKEVLHVSAKTGLGVEGVLEAIVRSIPPPSADVSAPLRALLFDSLCVLISCSKSNSIDSQRASIKVMTDSAA